MSLEENAAWIEKHKMCFAAWFTVDDLNHPAPRRQVVQNERRYGVHAGDQTRPQHQRRGEAAPRCKGKRQKAALTKLLDKMEQTGVELDNQPIFISHSDAPETVDLFLQMMTQRFHVNRKNITIATSGQSSAPIQGREPLPFLLCNRKGIEANTI